MTLFHNLKSAALGLDDGFTFFTSHPTLRVRASHCHSLNPFLALFSAFPRNLGHSLHIRFSATMQSTLFISLVGLLSLIAPAVAQTWTSCNPLNTTTCPTDKALGQTHMFDFTQTNGGGWNTTAGIINYDDMGAEFTVAQKGQSPTMQTEFYIFWGKIEVNMKVASGQGIVSSIVLESDDLDEIDWEMIGGNKTHVETNFFGKGNTTIMDRAIWYPMATPPQDNFHNYSVEWTKETIKWGIDGSVVRTLPITDPSTINGTQYPQTPMTVRLGIWAGGDSDNPNGTIQWAGGLTDYSQGPFTMSVKSINIQDYTTGYTTYKYGDMTGSWQSIERLNDTKPINFDHSVSKTAEQKWAGLSQTAKIAIIASVAGVLLVAFCAFIFCCVKQRR
jgi:hypothetical protein